jgi:hypothetical protein
VEMEEVGREVWERGVADVPGVWAAGESIVSESSGLCLLGLFWLLSVSAHRLINRPHGLRTAGLYSLGRLVGAKNLAIWHSVHGSRRRSEHGTCNNCYHEA